MEQQPLSFAIRGRRVGSDAPPFVIAEIGLEGGGSSAQALVDAASEAGADAVRVQTAEGFDERAHAEIVAHAHACGLAVLATPTSLAAADMLARLEIDAYRIASGDLTWDQLIASAAATGKPLVLATGMSQLDEIAHALEIARAAGARDLALLHCVSVYPVPFGSENLRAVRTLGDTFHLPVGLSDHAEDTFALPMAVALGATLYERRLVPEDADADDALDDPIASTPGALARAVAEGRRAQRALGDGQKVCQPGEAITRHVNRRSLCAARDLAAGEALTAADVVALRPAIGLAPSSLERCAGRRLRRAIPLGQPLREHDLEPLSVTEDACVS